MILPRSNAVMDIRLTRKRGNSGRPPQENFRFVSPAALYWKLAAAIVPDRK